MNWLKTILEEILAMIEDHEFEDLSPEDLEEISMIIHRPETVGREEAARFLGVSLSKFYELRERGLIPEPRKRKGFKERAYYMSDLRKVLKIIKLDEEKNH